MRLSITGGREGPWSPASAVGVFAGCCLLSGRSLPELEVVAVVILREPDPEATAEADGFGRAGAWSLASALGVFAGC
jgi:hypothetical protein